MITRKKKAPATTQAKKPTTRAKKASATTRKKKAPAAARPVARAFTPDQVRELTRDKRFLVAEQVKLDLPELASWDGYLLREHRLLVPIDVQALYVAEGSDEPMVSLPMLLAGKPDEANRPEHAMPPPFADGSPRPAGVHLHWATPDGLLRGKLEQRSDGAANRLSLPALPDRWLVLRIALPVGADQPRLTGWVLEAERARAVPLASFREGAEAAGTAAGVAIAKEQLTGTVGGALSWSGVYDAVLNRFAFHDPLADLAELAPSGVDQDCVSYLVAGWWSEPRLDVLDRARSSESLHELLDELRWGLLTEWGDEAVDQQREQAELDRKQQLGLTTPARWSRPRPAEKTPRALDEQRFLDRTFVEQPRHLASAAFATSAIERYLTPPFHLRSSLLHGSIFGVPVRGAGPADLRPAAGELAVALGQHDDDVIAALSSPAQASSEQRRQRELLLTAFTAQKIARIAAPDGVVEIEQHAHAAGFSSEPAGSAGTDRFLQRVQTGGTGGLDLGRHATSGGSPAQTKGAARAPGTLDSELFFASKFRPDLFVASAARIGEVARSRVGEVLSAAEARVANRPAARFTVATPPLVAIRGGSRSLRHGGDGRGSEDGKLTCRWPTHVVSEITGVIAADRFIGSLGNGSLPSETLALARETLLLDPYHDVWMARALSPPRENVKPLLSRLSAESALRFDADGRYDGATRAFRFAAVERDRTRAALRIEPGMRARDRMVADGLRKFSLYKGVDPDLVAVTSWAQPWIPMWLEWEVELEGIDPADLSAWTLGSIELAPRDGAFPGERVLARGRSLLTTGAASTLHAAVSDWLTAEDALDAIHAGLLDEATEASLRVLDEAVQHLDLLTAALDELRPQLLGLPTADGVQRPSQDGTILAPAPIAPPHALWAGSLRLTRARLLDAFGRTLDVPVEQVATPTQRTLAERPGTLVQPPRLLRPARFQFRLVAAATPVGSEGVEARVDQVEPSLAVSPVAGFLMPDHIDESLELFAADGAPLGELLHEAVSGGVLWEIAPGREGPADAGPLFGLAPAQRVLGSLAAGLVGADARARAGVARSPDAAGESALSALLRAIDTTLWTVDTFAALGSEHVAGLVGRPIAVVRAQLRLELKPPSELDLSDPARAAEWRAAEERTARYAFPVRIGELTRSDDGVLGFFVDDDYAHFRLVDKVIAGLSPQGGRGRGQLGLLRDAGALPEAAPIDHPYIAADDQADTLQLHVGQTITLTLLMHPAGRASLSSGLLPRKDLALARDWVAPGLSALAPSLRTGPVLVEVDLDAQKQVRLPKVSVFGQDQNFLWRDTPATWRHDAILAATQTALLPDTPAEVREGWIRVAPAKPTAADTDGAA